MAEQHHINKYQTAKDFCGLNPEKLDAHKYLYRFYDPRRRSTPLKLRLKGLITSIALIIANLTVVQAECRLRNHLDIFGDASIVSVDQYHFAIDD